jgi:hypothetical protein
MKLARLDEEFDASFFLLRSPLLEYEKAIALLVAIEADPDSTKERLAAIYQSPILMEAIYLSSPDLHFQVTRYLKNEITDKRSIKKIEQSLIQYFIRMCSRCTPFGLLAACSPGKFDSNTAIEFDGIQSLKRFARFDMDSICRMVEALKSDGTVRGQLVLYPNTSLYRSGDKFRYIEFSIADKGKTYTMQEVPYSSLLNKLIAKTSSGTSVEQLVLEIVKSGHDREDALAYVDELISAQVLVTNIDPALTDSAYLDAILKIESSTEVARNIVRILKAGEKSFQGINDVTDPTATYQQVEEDARSLNINIAREKLIQVDLFRQPLVCTVSSRTKQTTLEALNVMKALYGYRIKETRLEYFKRAFFEKYENTTVSVCEALDAISGLNFESLSAEDSHREPTNVVYDKIMQYKLSKYAEGLATGTATITREEVEAIGDNTLPPPDSFSVTISLFAENDAETILIKSAGGSSGVNMLSRFCYMDPTFSDDAKNVTRKEQELEPDRFVAEIVHLPESRLGNILIRPRLRDFEIPYMAPSQTSTAQTISVTDLYLRMEDGRLILFSKSLNKEILPRLTTAHNYTKKSLPVYHLLCELQYQGMQPGFTWHWGFLEGEKFLPRVTYKNVIISLACWNLDKTIVNDLISIKDDEVLKSRFSTFRKELKIPSLVYLVDYENEFLLNLESIISIRYLFNSTLSD